MRIFFRRRKAVLNRYAQPQRILGTHEINRRIREMEKASGMRY